MLNGFRNKPASATGCPRKPNGSMRLAVAGKKRNGPARLTKINWALMPGMIRTVAIRLIRSGRRSPMAWAYTT